MPASRARSVKYLLDSSAILAYLLDEPEAARVGALYQQAGLPFVALSELYAALWLRFGQAKSDEAIATIRHNGKSVPVYSVVAEARHASRRPLDIAATERVASEALEWLALCALGHGVGEGVA